METYYLYYEGKKSELNPALLHYSPIRIFHDMLISTQDLPAEEEYEFWVEDYRLKDDDNLAEFLKPGDTLCCYPKTMYDPERFYQFGYFKSRGINFEREVMDEALLENFIITMEKDPMFDVEFSKFELQQFFDQVFFRNRGFNSTGSLCWSLRVLIALATGGHRDYQIKKYGPQFTVQYENDFLLFVTGSEGEGEDNAAIKNFALSKAYGNKKFSYGMISTGLYYYFTCYIQESKFAEKTNFLVSKKYKILVPDLYGIGECLSSLSVFLKRMKILMCRPDEHLEIYMNNLISASA